MTPTPPTPMNFYEGQKVHHPACDDVCSVLVAERDPNGWIVVERPSGAYDVVHANNCIPVPEPDEPNVEYRVALRPPRSGDRILLAGGGVHPVRSNYVAAHWVIVDEYEDTPGAPEQTT